MTDRDTARLIQPLAPIKAEVVFFDEPKDCVVFDGDREGYYLLPTMFVVYAQRQYSSLSRELCEQLITEGAQRALLFPDEHPSVVARRRRIDCIRSDIEEALQGASRPSPSPILQLNSHIGTLVRHLRYLLEEQSK